MESLNALEFIDGGIIEVYGTGSHAKSKNKSCVGGCAGGAGEVCKCKSIVGMIAHKDERLMSYDSIAEEMGIGSGDRPGILLHERTRGIFRKTARYQTDSALLEAIKDWTYSYEPCAVYLGSGDGALDGLPGASQCSACNAAAKALDKSRSPKQGRGAVSGTVLHNTKRLLMSADPDQHGSKAVVIVGKKSNDPLVQILLEAVAGGWFSEDDFMHKFMINQLQALQENLPPVQFKPGLNLDALDRLVDMGKKRGWRRNSRHQSAGGQPEATRTLLMRSSATMQSKHSQSAISQ